MKRSTANGRNSVARFPHALNRCIDNCTSTEELMPQLRPRERFGGIGLGNWPRLDSGVLGEEEIVYLSI